CSNMSCICLQVLKLHPLADPASRLPFIETTLSTLRKEIDGTGTTLLGFVGTPWTLAAYSIEGKADKDCKETKVQTTCWCSSMCAHIIQLFDSWAHHLSPQQFVEFSLPYADRLAAALKAKYPQVPVIFHANGGTGKLETMKATSADVIGLDWATDIKTARNTLGEGVRVQGNLDPMILFGPEEKIVEATNQLLLAAGPHGHILNVGHGVIQGTPEAAVGVFCEAARRSGSLFAKSGSDQPLVGV
ncbi:hypothetical protein DUNSADRAFT_10910, partial [Dunaliella salina]